MRHRCFNPRAPHGARRRPLRNSQELECFNPRAPHGARRFAPYEASNPAWFQSTRPARGATSRFWFTIISCCVSIHAPRTGRDQAVQPTTPPDPLFQSTRPARGATAANANAATDPYGFNPRAPHGARPLTTHICKLVGRFQSTRPARGATSCRWLILTVYSVSIHAPRTGRDGAPCGM